MSSKYKLVPVEPTPEMLKAADLESGSRGLSSIALITWQAMIDAAPEPDVEPFGYLYPTGTHPDFRYFQKKRDGVDGMPVYTAPQPAKFESVAWQPIEIAPKGRIVLVYYTNQLGKGRVMRARYCRPETLESENTESGWADEGWYEESEAYEYLMPLEGVPTHWMPLPKPPGETHPPPAKREPVAAQQRFRHPQKGMPEWSVWQPCKVEQRPAWEIDSLGYEVEYRVLYTVPQPAKRKPLSYEELVVIGKQQDPAVVLHHNILAFTRAIEAAHGITGDTK